MKDLYSKIAQEEGVDRQTVKQLAFPFMYGMGVQFGAPLETQIRNAVRTAIKFGLAKKVTK